MPREPRAGDSTQSPREVTAAQGGPILEEGLEDMQRLQPWPFVEETLSHVFEYCIVSVERERLPSCTIMLL